MLYNYQGLDPETGYYSVVDTNEDGTLDYQDRTIAWNRNPEFFGGINNQLRYRDFSLQFLWQYVKQEGSLALFNTGSLENQRSETIDALNNGSEYQLISQTTDATRAYNNVLNSNYSITDASYLRLKMLNLRYNLPGAWTRRLGLNSASLFLTGQNIFTFSPYKGLDPELPFRGTSFGALRTITTGLNLKF